MRKGYALAVFGFPILLIFLSYGQTTIDAEFRSRSEFIQGFNQLLADGTKPAFFTLQRSRLNFNYKGGVVTVRLTLQISWLQKANNPLILKLRI